MEQNGFPVQAKDDREAEAVAARSKVPAQLRSCHTAIVDGYIIVGHVPVAEVSRLLTERPQVAGLAVAGMPAGSPGMEVAGVADEPFDVLAFDASGDVTVFAQY